MTMAGLSEETDLLVVGCGIAGLSAAVSALQSGLSVTLLERAPPEDFGGGTRWTEAYMRMKNDSEVSDDFEEAFARNAGWNLDPNLLVEAGGSYRDRPAWVKAHPFPDPEVVAAFAENATPTIAWLKSFGLKFEPQPIYLLTQNTTRIAAQGGGLALIERLMQEAKALGAKVLYRTTAIDLLRDDSGRIADHAGVEEGASVCDHAGNLECGQQPQHGRACVPGVGIQQGAGQVALRQGDPRTAHERAGCRADQGDRVWIDAKRLKCCAADPHGLLIRSTKVVCVQLKECMVSSPEGIACLITAEFAQRFAGGHHACRCKAPSRAKRR